MKCISVLAGLSSTSRYLVMFAAGTLFFSGELRERFGRFERKSMDGRLTRTEQNRNMLFASLSSGSTRMSPRSQPDAEADDGLETAVDQAIAACGGDPRSAIRALIVANEYLETEVGELMKAVSHAYARGRFQSYSG
jgi:hypothetical protein